MKRHELSQEHLKSLLRYDEETGVFTWLERPSRRTFAGDRAGSIRPTNGRRYITIKRVDYAASRLALFYVHGKWPDGVVDHKNGIVDDDRLDNLRDVTSAVNSQNRHGPSSLNTTGVMGVSRARAKFKAVIFVDGQYMNLGRYETADEAGAAYLTAKRILHPGCTL